jgi:hypothetical protein
MKTRNILIQFPFFTTMKAKKLYRLNIIAAEIDSKRKKNPPQKSFSLINQLTQFIRNLSHESECVLQCSYLIEVDENTDQKVFRT